MELIAIAAAVTVLILILIYKYLTSTFDYFSKQGIPGPRPIPIFGTCWGSWKRIPGEEDLERMKKYGKVFGTFNGRTPKLFVADPILIKKILVQEFNSFRNQQFTSNQEVMRKNLASLVDDEWKKVRTIISPSFTSAKLKKIVPLLEQQATDLVDHFQGLEANEKINAQSEFDVYLLNLICDVVFGTKLDSVNTPDHPLVYHTKKMLSFEGTDSPMAILPVIFGEYLSSNVDRFFPKESTKYIADLCLSIVKDRKSAEKRNDFVDILLEAAENERKIVNSSEDIVLTDEVIAGQIMVFLLAGYVSSSLILTYCVHTLATHSNHQERLREEVSAKMEKHGDGLTLEVLSEMKFLDMFVNEILRLYPTDYRVERVCNNSVEIDGIKFEEGLLVSIPMYGIHRNEELYPDPLTFDPNRFSAEEKASRDPYTFIPFGDGPRNCIGMRFALTSIKIGLCHLIKEFKFNVCKETMDPLEFHPGVGMVLFPKPIFVSIQRRES